MTNFQRINTNNNTIVGFHSVNLKLVDATVVLNDRIFIKAKNINLKFLGHSFTIQEYGLEVRSIHDVEFHDFTVRIRPEGEGNEVDKMKIYLKDVSGFGYPVPRVTIKRDFVIRGDDIENDIKDIEHYRTSDHEYLTLSKHIDYNIGYTKLDTSLLKNELQNVDKSCTISVQYTIQPKKSTEDVITILDLIFNKRLVDLTLNLSFVKLGDTFEFITSKLSTSKTLLKVHLTYTKEHMTSEILCALSKIPCLLFVHLNCEFQKDSENLLKILEFQSSNFPRITVTHPRSDKNSLLNLRKSSSLLIAQAVKELRSPPLLPPPLHLLTTFPY